MVTIELPKPVSANVYWRRGKWGMYTHPKATVYKADVALAWALSGHAMLEGPRLAVTMHCYICDKRADMANWEKVTLDALQGYAYADDNAVVELHMYRYKARTRKLQKVIVSIQDSTYGE